MILIYLETPLGVPGNYVLLPLWYIFPASTTASPGCPIVRLPSDFGSIWISIDEEKIHMEWEFCIVLQNFCLNGNALFEINMFGLLPRHYPLQDSVRWPINGMGIFHVI